MHVKTFFAALIIFSFLASTVAMAAESDDISAAEAKAKTPVDHIKLAEYYENQAKLLKAKIEEEKEILDEYDNHSYYYGPEGQLYESHHEAMLREYEKAVERSIEIAASHRKMAEKMKGVK